MSVIGRSRGPLGSSLAAWEASGGVRRGPGRPQKATVCVADWIPTRVTYMRLRTDTSQLYVSCHITAESGECTHRLTPIQHTHTSSHTKHMRIT